MVTLLADPGLPADIADELAADLPGELCEHVSGSVAWEVRVVCDRLMADESGEIRLAEIARGELAQDGDAVVICLTDQPRRAGLRPVLADANADSGVALASLPALGAVALRRRTRRTIVGLVGELLAEELEALVAAPDVRGEHPFGRLVRRVASPDDDIADDDIGVRFLRAGARGHLRLLVGMVRANRPWRLIPSLSGAFVGALATGAYALVNFNIWRLADTLSPARLAVATGFALAAMVAWLIVKHQLWERPSGTRARSLALLYNAATVSTLAVGVVCLYVGLFVLSLMAGGFVIEGNLFRQTLGHRVGWVDYATVAWMASSMGTIGGALGSGFDSGDAVREAAYGYRQRERQRRDIDAAGHEEGDGRGRGR